MSERKKVLHIVESFGSGVFSFLTDLINETHEKFDIYIAYGVRDETPQNFADYFDKSVKFIMVNNFGRSISPLQDFKAYVEIKKIIRQVKPDIIHLHSSKAGFIGRFAANCKKTRVLYNPHGFSFLMQDSSALKRKIYWGIEKIATFNNATTVGCSYGEYVEAKKLSKKCVCINNGINIATMQNLTKSLSSHTFNKTNPKICTCARIGFQKQPAVFNKVAQNFLSFDFTWIGDGELKSELVSPNICVSGWKEKCDALKILNDSDIFILTSAWEGLPLSLLEAMYMKKLCIVSNVIGNRDVIQNGINGFVCSNEQEFSDTINKVLRFDADVIEKITSRGKNDVLEKYNVSKNVKEKYVAEYLK